MYEKSPVPTPSSAAGPRVAARTIVSRPESVIQVERIIVSRAQQEAVSAAIRLGRQYAACAE